MFQGNIGRLLSSTMTESQVGDEFWKGISDERIFRLFWGGGYFLFRRFPDSCRGVSKWENE